MTYYFKFTWRIKLPSGNTLYTFGVVHEHCKNDRFDGITCHISSNAAILCSELHSAAPGRTRSSTSIHSLRGS